MSEEKKQKPVLLIFDWFGEKDLQFFFIEEPPKWLRKCHNHFVGAMGNDSVAEFLNRVHDAICDNPEHYGNPYDELAGAWVKHKVDVEKAFRIRGKFRIVVTGIIP